MRQRTAGAPGRSSWTRLLALAPIVVLLAGVSTTVQLDRSQREAARLAEQRRFDNDSRLLVDSVLATLARYEKVNTSVADAVAPVAGRRATAEEFSVFADSLILASRYPATFGVAWADAVPRARLAQFQSDPTVPITSFPDLRPDESRETAAIVTYAEPDSTMAIARGVDAQLFPPIAEALNAAELANTIVMSAPFELPLRVGPDRNEAPVLTFFVHPYTDKLNERERGRGWAALALDMKNFAEVASSSLGSRYAIRIDDVGAPLEGKPLSANELSAARDGRSTTIDRNVYGRTWRFRISEAKGVDYGGARVDDGLLATGLLVTGTVFIIVALLTWSERRAQRLVDRATAELAVRATTDDLTGLLNRPEMRARIDNWLAEDRSVAALSVLFLDLDDFKLVNDSLGHACGDRLLKLVAERLTQAAGSFGEVARLGGDEFVIVVPGADEEVARHVADEVRAALEVPFAVGANELFVRTSIGIAVSEPGAPAVDAHLLLQRADAAMYAAKNAESQRVAVFTPELLRDADERLALVSDLRRGLDLDAFELAYQQVVEIGTGDIVGWEALVRWRHPERGLLLPQHFLEVAVETGLIAEIDAQVRRMAFAMLSEHDPRSVPWVAVNVSARELASSGFAAGIMAALDDLDLDPARVVLEITETDLARDPVSAADALASLRRRGVRVAVDDFGTGYSGLSNLRRLPADLLKIDRSLVSAAPESRADRAVLRSIVDLGHALGLRLVAEGVETAEHLRVLVELGCDLAQGWFYGRELPVEELPRTAPVPVSTQRVPE